MNGLVALIGVGIEPSNTGITLSNIWPLLVVMFAGAGGVFAFLVKHIAELRTENRELRDKVMDQVVPALTENTLASKAMMESTVRLQSALAVAEDHQRDRERRR